MIDAHSGIAELQSAHKRFVGTRQMLSHTPSHDRERLTHSLSNSHHFTFSLSEFTTKLQTQRKKQIKLKQFLIDVVSSQFYQSVLLNQVKKTLGPSHVKHIVCDIHSSVNLFEENYDTALFLSK